MEIKDQRLENLASQVKSLRSKGNVSRWPEEVRREAVFLLGRYGPTAVSSRTKLSTPSLYCWKRELSTGSRSEPYGEEKEIIVTHMTSSRTAPSVEQVPKLWLLRGELEVKVFCSELAERFLQRVTR